MILSAMMFALGVFVTGLLALGFCIALVRRTRRVTERRLMAVVTARRGEFEAERDELRARYAVQTHRLEREIARVLDMATAHRLDADVKDRDLLNAQAELDARRDEIQELQERLGEHRETLQEVERKYAESSTALRAARHALKLESRRRAAMEDPLDQALAVADEKQIELSALRAQVEALRLELAQSGGSEAARPRAEYDGVDLAAMARSPGVIALPLRPRAGQGMEAGSGWTASETQLDDAGPETGWAVPPTVDDDGSQIWPGVAIINGHEDGSAVRSEPSQDAGALAAAASEGPGENAETLFVEALAEIRALKRAASSQAAE